MDFLLKVFPIKVSQTNSKTPEIVHKRGSAAVNSMNQNPISEESKRQSYHQSF
jgi:hypothetical protein